MKTIIDNPTKLSKELITQLLELIENGSQVDSNGLYDRIMRAELIAIRFDNNVIVTTATLKNPFDSYRKKVFTGAGIAIDTAAYNKELGYIVTNPKYEGKKHCQALLEAFMPVIAHTRIFATTRKSAMIHILSKYGFTIAGTSYNEDLQLLLYTPLED